MHRNTAILLAVLAVTAALLVGLAIGRRISGNPQSVTNNLQSSPTLPPGINNLQPTPSAAKKSSTNKSCGLSFTYPENMQLTEASDSAQLTNTTTGEQIILLCGVVFPKPPLIPERIETATVAGQTATVYHDASAKDGKPIDVVVFTHPKNKLEIALFGFGEVFERILQNLQLDPP